MSPDARSRLEARLVELQSRQARITLELGEPLDRDSEEAAIELEDDQSLERQQELVEAEILSVRRALDRVSRGTYGTCIRCRSGIGKNRLAARPEAALCIKCARDESGQRIFTRHCSD